jgi:arginine exporter protein ArgO
MNPSAIASGESIVGGAGAKSNVTVEDVFKLTFPAASTLWASKMAGPKVTFEPNTSEKEAMYCHRPCASAMTFTLPVP